MKRPLRCTITGLLAVAVMLAMQPARRDVSIRK